MGFFSRRRKANAKAEADTTAEVQEDTGTEAAEVAEPQQPSGRGPWDVADVPELGKRLDLGALRIPGRQGLQMRMEVEKRTQQVVSVGLAMSGSALQVQAFAAPRSEGLWQELRPEIIASVEKQGGTADEADGPFGREILARLPVKDKEGRGGHRAARFIGVDGPRWFLRGVVSGKAAIDPDAAEELEGVFADIVVVRGSEARAPRDVLALQAPGKPAAQAAQPDQATQTVTLDPLTRGPEITEIR